MRDSAHPAPKLLFIPVSGPFGMGEYARSLAIAHAARTRWPAADIRFVLSREAPYAGASPYPATLLPSSPTFHSSAVIELMESLRPDIVIFDNAGRTAQLAAARRLGARLVYISARGRQRRKAFRLRWMRLLDEHWLAYPQLIAGGLTLRERLKRRLVGRPAVRFLDVIIPRTDAERRGALAARVGANFVLFVPGGGTGHPGVDDAASQFRLAAEEVARSGVTTVSVGAASAATAAARSTTVQPAAATPVPAAPSSAARALHLPLMPLADLAELLRTARIVVANGGSTLLQAIACGAPVVAAPIAGDQAERIRRCADAGVALEARLDAAALAAAVRGLLDDEARRAALAARAAAFDLADGLEVAVAALENLVGAPRAMRTRVLEA